MPLTPLILTDLSVSYGERPVLDGIDLVVQPGRRIALVGENGAGKSTLLRAVAGRLPRRARVSGTIDAPDDLVMLGQEPPFPRRGDDRRRAGLDPAAAAATPWPRWSGWRAELGDAAAAAAYDAALELARRPRRVGRRPARRGGRRAARRRRPRPGPAGRHPLGRPAHPARTGHDHDHPADLPAAGRADQPPRRRRARRAGGLPRGLPGVVLFASHDRVFLDDVATDLVDLDPSAFGTDGEGGRRFGGGWSGYEEHARRARDAVGGDLRRAAGGAHGLRAATALGTEAIAHNRGPARQRQVHLRVQGCQRRAGLRPAQARRRAAPGGGRAASRSASRRHRCASTRRSTQRGDRRAGRAGARPRGGRAAARSTGST